MDPQRGPSGVGMRINFYFIFLGKSNQKSKNRAVMSRIDDINFYFFGYGTKNI